LSIAIQTIQSIFQENNHFLHRACNIWYIISRLRLFFTQQNYNQRKDKEMQYFIIGAFAIYLIIMLGIGFLFSNKSSTLGDYYLGNRKMNKWVVALSAQASDMSGWLLMGLPGAVYVSGLSASWIGVGLVIGTYLNWKIVAKRLRTYSHACNDSVTIPEFFSNRFHDNSGILRGVAALIILLFFLFYTVSGFVACTKLFTTTFGITPMVALIVGVIVIVSYTLLGGFMAVCWTDLIQGTLMFFAIVIVPALVIYQAGGWTSSINSLNEANPYYLNIFTNAKDGSAVSFLTDIISNVGWGLGYFGMPHILVRFMAIKSPRQITESRRIAMTWVVVSLAAAIAVGVLGHIFASQHGVMVKDSEEIFMLMIKQLFHPAIVGVMMSAILAAIMSTADSQLLVSASAFSNDIYKKWIHKNASNKELVIVSRISVGIIAVIAAFIAAADPESDFLKQVMALVSFAWAGFGAAFGPVILLALFWKRTNIYGAGAGMVIGALTAIIWKFVLAANFPEVTIFKLYEIVPGFLLSLITIVVVSLLTKAPSKEITDEFEKVASNDL
jgi:sodium/proline symporter